MILLLLFRLSASFDGGNRVSGGHVALLITTTRSVAAVRLDIFMFAHARRAKRKPVRKSGSKKKKKTAGNAK